MNDKLTLRIGGERRVISPEVLLKHIATALRTVDLPSGQHEIEIHGDGAISLNGMLIYQPSRPQIAKRGA